METEVTGTGADFTSSKHGIAIIYNVRCEANIEMFKPQFLNYNSIGKSITSNLNMYMS